MLLKHLTALRRKYHPFHSLKRNKFFSTVIHPLLDVPFYAQLHDTKWRVRVRFMRHLSFIVNSRIVEPRVASLFLALPPRFHDRADEILDRWRAIHGEWMGEPGTPD